MIQWKCFVVRLRKKAATLYDYEAVTGAFQLKALSNGIHYYQAMQSATTTPGKNFDVWLNPTMFKIIKKWRFNLGQMFTTMDGKQYKNLKCTVKGLPWMEGLDDANPYWYLQRTPRLPTQNVFLLMFNDNSGADAEYPNFSVATMYKVLIYPN